MQGCGREGAGEVGPMQWYEYGREY